MPEIPKHFAKHNLNIKEGFKLVKQTLHRFFEPKRQAMGKVLTKLLEVGFIRDI